MLPGRQSAPYLKIRSRRVRREYVRGDGGGCVPLLLMPYVGSLLSFETDLILTTGVNTAADTGYRDRNTLSHGVT